MLSYGAGCCSREATSSLISASLRRLCSASGSSHSGATTSRTSRGRSRPSSASRATTQPESRGGPASAPSAVGGLGCSGLAAVEGAAVEVQPSRKAVAPACRTQRRWLRSSRRRRLAAFAVTFLSVLVGLPLVG